MDGSSFYLDGDSLADYVTHPVFLRFAFIALLIHVLLSAESADLLEVWACALMGYAASLLLFVGIWMAFSRAVPHGARNRRSIFTPLAIVPVVVLSQLGEQAVAVLAGSGGWVPLSDTLVAIGRDCAVFMLFDLIHAHYVAPAHPLARMGAGPVFPPPEAPTAQPATENRAPDAAAEAPETPPELPPHAGRARAAMPPAAATVQVGALQIPIADILMIRTEDHYLGITTSTGKTLQRTKLSDLVELHEAAVGIQINRSVWIAFAAIATVDEAERGQVVVTLTNGDQERVSKPRVYAFREMYRSWASAARG